MPAPAGILEQLANAANDYRAIAIVWHVAVALATGMLARGWRPSQRALGAWLVLPLASVVLVSAAIGNPFNAVVLSATAVALALVATGMPPSRVQRGALWSTLTGVALVGLGLVYPHFLRGPSPFAYLVAAPFGIVPCPTLAFAVGVTLAAGGLGSRLWCAVLGAVALFYGLFGALVLGVRLDFALAAGALALAPFALVRRATGAAPVDRALGSVRT